MFVECGSQSGRFNISETAYAAIKGMHFIGCGGNRVSYVGQFVVNDTTFQGVDGRGAALILKMVDVAGIINSSFLSNTHSSMFKHHDHSSLVNLLKPNSLLAVGGAIYKTLCNVLIVKSQFAHNTAKIGGALFAHNSSLHVVESTYSHNRASFGGVMITSNSFVNIDNSNFSKNEAEVSASWGDNNIWRLI